MNKHNSLLLKALEQARLGSGSCAPNPAVGAVVVYHNEIIAQGYHRGPGKPHAEVEAIAQVDKALLAQCELYVTLEPCCHHGRTPPCTELIIHSQIKRVFFAYLDPNPIVAGKGQQRLLQAGISCEQVSVKEIDDFYRSYSHWQQHKKPWLIAKIAQTLDGKISQTVGQATQITGQACQQFTHQQRQQSDGILTTAQTIQCDDPQLNIRLTEQPTSKPLFIYDSQLTLSPQAKIWQNQAPITIFHSARANPERKQALEKQRARCIEIENLPQMLTFIGEFGIQRLWCEAGGRFFNWLQQQQLLNEIYIYIAAKTFGETAVPAYHAPLDLTQASFIEWQSAGPDVIGRIVLER